MIKNFLNTFQAQRLRRIFVGDAGSHSNHEEQKVGRRHFSDAHVSETVDGVGLATLCLRLGRGQRSLFWAWSAFVCGCQIGPWGEVRGRRFAP